MKKFLILAILFCPCASAQIVNVDAGANQLMNAEGVNFRLWFPASEDDLSLGFLDGHFSVGANDERDFEGGRLAIGDKTFFASGAYVPFRGISWTRGNKKKKFRYSLFAGGVGELRQAPFLSAMTTNHFGMGGNFDAKIRGLQTSSLLIFEGNQKTLLESVSRDWNRKVDLQAQMGLLSNRGILSGTLRYQPVKWVSLFGSQNADIYKGTESETDSLGGGLFWDSFGVHAALFNGSENLIHTSGDSLGLNFKVGLFSISTDYFRSSSTGNPETAQEDVNVTERVNRHLSMTEYFSRKQDGTWTENYGGAITTNRVKASLSYQTIFLPVPIQGSAFDQIAAVSISLQFPRVSANYSTYITPTGKSFVTADANTFVRGPIQTTNGPRTAGSASGKYAIEGICLDDKNKPVAGCEIEAGKSAAYSGNDGTFRIQVRSKTRIYPILVRVEQFSAPGEWEVLSTIKTAQAGLPIMVVVKQKS